MCDDGWDKKAARVACRMLGFADGEPTLGSRYGNVEDDMAMDDISCSGRESSLYDCDYSSSDNCDGNEGAGVVCTDIGNYGNYGNMDTGVISEYSQMAQTLLIFLASCLNQEKKLLRKITVWPTPGRL